MFDIDIDEGSKNKVACQGFAIVLSAHAKCQGFGKVLRLLKLSASTAALLPSARHDIEVKPESCSEASNTIAIYDQRILKVSQLEFECSVTIL